MYQLGSTLPGVRSHRRLQDADLDERDNGMQLVHLPPSQTAMLPATSIGGVSLINFSALLLCLGLSCSNQVKAPGRGILLAATPTHNIVVVVVAGLWHLVTMIKPGDICCPACKSSAHDCALCSTC